MMKTRRQFLSQSVMLTSGALLSSLDATAYPTQPNVTFPANPRDRLAVASYPFRDFTPISRWENEVAKRIRGHGQAVARVGGKGDVRLSWIGGGVQRR